MSDFVNVNSSFSSVVVNDSTEVVLVTPVFSVLPLPTVDGGSPAKAIEDTNCHYGIKCYKSGCKYKHPDGYTPTPATCRYGSKCKVAGCPRAHPEGFIAPKAMILLPGGSMVPVITLEDYPILSVAKPKVKDEPTMLVWSSVVGGGGASSSSEATVEIKSCRHTEAGRDCFDRGCKFKHPVGYKPGPKIKCRKGAKCSGEGCLFAHPTDPEWRHL